MNHSDSKCTLCVKYVRLIYQGPEDCIRSATAVASERDSARQYSLRRAVPITKVSQRAACMCSTAGCGDTARSRSNQDRRAGYQLEWRTKAKSYRSPGALQ